MRFPNLNSLWAHAIVDELVRSAGVREAVVAPGSRSAALALACAEHPRLHTWSVLDERSAGFFALGVGKQSGAPALVVVTSGTAGAHLAPSVLEAEMAGVPLIVLTADRPWELHGFGAPQTVEQETFFQGHVRAAFSLPAPEATDDVLAHLRASACRAAALALGPRPGPVHLNVPFREPLAPLSDGQDLSALSPTLRDGRSEGAPFLDLRGTVSGPDAAAIARVRTQLARAGRGIIVCGPRDRSDGLAVVLERLSADTGYPLLTEAASQLRFGLPGSVRAYDVFLRDERVAHRLRPELVLRVGTGLTSKRLQRWLDASGAPVVLFSENGQFSDPGHRALLALPGDAVGACQALMGARRPLEGWQSELQAVEGCARRALAAAFEEDSVLSEPRVAHEVARSLPAGAQLFVASSMPVRDVDAFAHGAANVRVLSNRGANGIDGLVSSAVGVAVAAGKPTLLLTGDLGLIHDLGGLVTARRAGISLCVVVVNNDGGGIFSFLPIAKATPRFESLFGTPHGLSFQSVAAFVGARHWAPDGVASLRKALSEALEGGLSLIEVRTDRAANVEVHEVLGRRVVRALEQEGYA
jgi:2-succinyl-5-enolpyruvyl-6-hydroxy-3-cyclohexene-1-carboxylate synthase